MTANQEKEIIKLIKLRVDKNGDCIIGPVAREILQYEVPSSFTSAIAAKISRSKLFLVKKYGNDWIVKKNHNSGKSILTIDTESKLSALHLVIGSVMAIVTSLLLWKFVGSVPSYRPSERQSYDQIMADTSSKWMQNGKEITDTVLKKELMEKLKLFYTDSNVASSSKKK